MENIPDIGGGAVPIGRQARWRRVFVFFGAFALIMALGAGAFFGVRYYRYRQGYLLPMERYEAYMDIFRNDTYGGATPEETLRLFVAALRAGDVEKASSYFMPDDRGSREKWLAILSENYAKNKAEFLAAAETLTGATRGSSSYEGQVWYKAIYNGKEILVDMAFNGKVWKIDNL